MRRSTGRKTTYQVLQKRDESYDDEVITSDDEQDDTKDKRKLMYSGFVITVNTNVHKPDDIDIANDFGRSMEDVCDQLGYRGMDCRVWGTLFKVNTGQGRKYLDKKQRVPNPKYNANYNSFYAEDDKKGIEHWITLLESMHVESGGAEWAPGTKKNRKNQYLHAHIFVKVMHRTRLLVDTAALAAYFKEEMCLPHKPYVHVDVVRDNTQKIIDYIMKNGWNKNSRFVTENADYFFVSNDK